MITGDTLTTYLGALSTELAAQGRTAEILLIGGGVIVACFHSRELTHDLDIKLLENASSDLFFRCADKVAQTFGLEADWINCEADSHGYITPEIVRSATPWLSFPALGVHRPSTQALLAMKINAARINPKLPDINDTATLLAELDIDNIGDAIGIWAKHYPDITVNELIFRDKKQFLRQAFAAMQ